MAKEYVPVVWGEYHRLLDTFNSGAVCFLGIKERRARRTAAKANHLLPIHPDCDLTMALRVDSGRLKLLEMERAAILTAINDVRAKYGDKQQEQLLDDLLADYNRIAKTIDHIPNLNARDPLHILPLEVWIQVIIWSLPSADDTSALLLLTMVSPDWMDTLTSIPTLWTHIRIDPCRNDPWATIAVFLHFSREVSVSVTAPISLGAIPETLATIIGPHASRIHELIVLDGPTTRTSGEDVQNDSIEHLYKIVEALSFPKEISIFRMHRQNRTVVGAVDAPQLLNIITPLVRVLENIFVTYPAFRFLYPHLPLLEGAFVDGNLDEILALLRKAPPLEFLSVNHAKERDQEGVPAAAHETADSETTKTLRTRMSVGRLREFHFQDENYSSKLPSLTSLIAFSPVLRDINLSIGYWLMDSLIFVIGQVASLQNLAITLIEGGYNNPFLEPPTAIPPKSGLKSLTLVTSARDGRRGGGMAYVALLDVLFRVLATQFIEVTHLHLDFRVTPVTFELLHNYMSSLSRLRCLYLELPIYSYEPPHDLVQLPNLEEFTANHDQLASKCIMPNVITLKTPWLEPISNNPGSNLTNVRNLEMTAAAHYGAAQGPNVSQLPQLVRIKIRIHDFTDIVNFPSFPYLTTVNLSAHHLTYPQCTLFCASLLYEPHHFPRLETIEFGAMPELDLLFLMLERRNFLADSSICRIRKLTLPVLGRHMRDPLASLLKGFYSLRPSLLDLSTEGTRAALFDENRPGCRLCIQQELGPCDMPVVDDSVGDKRIGMDMRNHDNIRDPYDFELLPPSPSLPPDIRTWIEKRSERISAWSSDYLAWHLALRTRTFACSGTKRDSPVKISDSDAIISPL